MSESSLAIPGRLTATSLELPPDLSRDDWVKVGQTLKDMDRGIQWWIGDWWAFGERAFGEEVWQYLERSEKTLANWAYVARKVEPSRRRETIRFSHHAEVAKLEPAEQEMVLAEAEREQYSVTRTRQRAEEVEHDRIANENGRTVEVYEEPQPAHVIDDEPAPAGVVLEENAFVCKECGAVNHLGDA